MAPARKLIQQYLNTCNSQRFSLSNLKEGLLRLDSSFTEKTWGFPTFKSFCQHFVGDLFTELVTDGSTCFVSVDEKEDEESVCRDAITSAQLSSEKHQGELRQKDFELAQACLKQMNCLVMRSKRLAFSEALCHHLACQG